MAEDVEVKMKCFLLLIVSEKQSLKYTKDTNSVKNLAINHKKCINFRGGVKLSIIYKIQLEAYLFLCKILLENIVPIAYYVIERY